MQLITAALVGLAMFWAGYLFRGWIDISLEVDDVIEKFSRDRVAFREFERQQAYKKLMQPVVK